MFKTESRVNTNGFLQVYQSLVGWKEESKVVCYKSITLAENNQYTLSAVAAQVGAKKDLPRNTFITR